MSSIRRRLSAGLAIGLVVGMGLLGTVLGVLLTQLAEDFVVSRLQHDGESLLEALQLAPADGSWSVTPGRVGAIYRRALSGHYWLVLSEGGQRLYSRSLWDEELEVQALAQGSSRHWLQQGPLQQRLLVWSGGFRKQGQQLTLVVAEDLTPLLGSYRRLGWMFAGLSIAVLAVLLFLQRWLINRGFRPVERSRKQLQRLRQGELKALDERVPDELRPLVVEINRLLSLFDERLQRSRHAVGNLAHALKAPLGVLRGLPAQPPIAAELDQQTSRIQQLLERELKRARLAGRGVPGQQFDPAAELPTLVELLEKIHASRAIRFDCQAAAVRYRLDRDDMLELLGNLLDNAGKWADEQVRCRLGGGGERLSLTVEDDGPGCSDELLQQLTERGVRVDEGVPGHGLGLAIVSDIVSQYHGELVFGRSAALGGLLVEVHIGDQRDDDSGRNASG